LRAAIIGAGPAGTLSALNLYEKAEVIVFESKQSPGFPVKCGGLVSSDCFEELKKYCRVEKALLNRIKGAFFFSPSGKFAEVTGKTGGIVIERKILDSMLLKKAGEVAEIRMKSKVLAVSGNRLKFASPEGENYITCDIILGADGTESTVAVELGFERPEIFSGKQYLIEFEPMKKNMVELYFGKRYSDGFFGYSIPVSDDLARVGVVSRKNPSAYLERLLRSHPSVSERAGKSIIEVNLGAVPIGIVDFVGENAALIGDSAGMVKPYTGGGIYYLLKAAEVLGEKFPDLHEFKREYMRRFGKEYRIGEKIRRLYDIFDDRDYDSLIGIARDIDFSRIHMDRPSTALEALPRLLRIIKNISLSSKVLMAFLDL